MVGGIAALLSVYWIGYEMGQDSNKKQEAVISGEYEERTGSHLNY